MVWFGMLYGWIIGGLVKMVKDIYYGIVMGLFVYYMFIVKLRGFVIDVLIVFGEVLYCGIKCSMSMNVFFFDFYM